MATYTDTFLRGPVTYTAGADPGGTADARWSAAVRTWVETGLSGRADLKTKADDIVGDAHPDNAALIARRVTATFYDGGVGIIVAHYQCKDASDAAGTLWSIRCGWRVVDWPGDSLGSEGASFAGVSPVFSTEAEWRLHPSPWGIPQVTMLKRYRSAAPSTDLAIADMWDTLASNLTAGSFGDFNKDCTVYLGVSSASEYYTGAATKAQMVAAWKYDFKGFGVPYVTTASPLAVGLRVQIC